MLERLLKLLTTQGPLCRRIRHPVSDMMDVCRYPQELREIRFRWLVNPAEYSEWTAVFAGSFHAVVHEDCRMGDQTD